MILLITKYNLCSKKVQLLIFLIFYFICIQLYYFDNHNICVCMQGNAPIAPRPDSNMDYTLHLEYENTYLRQRIETLERILQTEISQHALDNACSNQTINTLLQENLSLQNQLNQINHEISVAAEMIDNSQNIFAESIQDQSNIREEVTPTRNII